MLEAKEVLGGVKQAPKKLDSKEQIFFEAGKLFATKGFDGTSVRDISGAAKVNVALINYHFKTKQNLYHEVAKHGVKELEAAAEKLAGEDIYTVVEQLFRYSVDKEGPAYYIAVVMNLFTNPNKLSPELMKDIMSRSNSWLDTLAAGVKQELAGVSVPEGEIIKAAHYINSYLIFTAQISFGMGGNTEGYLNQFYDIPEGETPGVVMVVDQAKHLVEGLKARYKA